MFPIAPIINRYIMAKFAKTQFNLNRLWNPVPCDIATLYAGMLTLFTTLTPLAIPTMLPYLPYVLHFLPSSFLRAVLLQAVSLCLLYAPMYPPLYLITAFVVLGTW